MLKTHRRRTAVASMLTLTLCALVLSACQKAQPNGAAVQSGAQSGTQADAGIGSAGTGSGGATGSGQGSDGGQPVEEAYPQQADAYAKAAVGAWAAGDVARLDQLEPQGGLLHTMLVCHGCYETHFALVNCEGAAGSTYCLFFNKVGDELRLRLQNAGLGEARAVGQGGAFEPIIFPPGAKQYAQEALDAWLSHNDARLSLLTYDKMSSANVDALGAGRAVTWTYDGGYQNTGAAFVQWRNPAGGHLIFRFVAGGPAPTTGPASQHRIMEITYQPA